MGGGAYSYEWAQRRNGYGREKPSYAWLRWHREEHEVRKSTPRSLTDLYLMKSGRNGLVPKKVTVTRGGKSFVTTVWVKGNSEENTKKNQGKPLEYKNITEYERAENDFRGIQEDCRRLPDEQVRGFHSGSKEPDEGVRERLSRVLGRWISCVCNGDRHDAVSLVNEKRGTRFEIYPNVDSELFHDVFQVVRTYLYSGDAVDLHDDYSECRCYLSKDGLSGFAIEPDGNLVSVFSLRRGFLPTCGKYIVEQGAVKLDCYESRLQNLPSIYKKTLGFELASRLKFDRALLEEDRGREYADWFVRTYGEADVLFMAKGDNLQQRTFADYDEAIGYRNSLLPDDVRKSLTMRNVIGVGL